VSEIGGESEEEEGERVVIGFVPSPERRDERSTLSDAADADVATAAGAAAGAATGGNHRREVTVLESNFDRLGVHSVTARVSVGEGSSDEDSNDDGYDDYKAKAAGKERWEDASRLRAKPAFGPGRRESDTDARQRPKYTEAVGEARLAWMWVQGWRARLRKGGDVVEKARLEWQLDSREEVSKSAPVVVVEERETVGGGQG
jgi:hypothetical protein